MTMYCPNCGAKTSLDQNFCRACGFSLEKTALSLSEQLPAKVDLSLQARKDRLEKLGVAALSVFGFGLLSLLVYGIGFKLIDKGILGILAMLGVLIMLVCGLGSVILFAKAKELDDMSSKRRPQNLSSGNETTKELLSEGHFEPVPTVTEHTTELLTVKKRNTDR